MAVFGGWINAIIPILIVPYYSVIGGWVIKYLVEYLKAGSQTLAEDGYFSAFIANGFSTEICFLFFTLLTLVIIYAGVRNGVERVSKFMMPILVVLSVVIAIYSVTGQEHGRGEIFSGTKYRKFFMDDSGCGNGTDVLFSVDRNGYSGNFWFLYEKRCIH